MPKKVLTPWDIAKPLLEDDYLNNVVNETMARQEVWSSRREFQAVPINNFGNNWLAMKRRIGALKSRAEDDAEALLHDRAHYPKKSNRWDDSAAKAMLEDDVKNNKHTEMGPKNLWLSKNEYKDFDLKQFRQHIYQEKRSKLETNYWLVKMEKKRQRKLGYLKPHADDVEFFDGQI